MCVHVMCCAVSRCRLGDVISWEECLHRGAGGGEDALCSQPTQGLLFLIVVGLSLESDVDHSGVGCA